MRKNFLFIILCGLIAAAAFVAGQISEKANRHPRTAQMAMSSPSGPAAPQPSAKRKILYYRDPMNPAITYKHPGKAPCGMDRVPVYAKSTGSAQSGATAGASSGEKPEGKGKILYWRSSMDPGFISKKPGKDSMGMDLVPVYANQLSSGEVTISPTVVQDIGVTTTKAVSAPFNKTIRTYGTTQWNEKTLAAINTKLSGWIEKLYVQENGQVVRKGQPLLKIYSPELVSAQQEYLSALDNAKALDKAKASQGASLDTMIDAAAKLPESARMRLRLWDISGGQIRELEKTRRVRKTLTLYAPFDGIVTDRKVIEGDYIKPGMNLMTIAGLNPIWTMGYIYEDEIPMVKKGMPATLNFDSIPGKTFHGVVDYVYPYVQGKSRTSKVRIVLANPNQILLPDMYGTVKINAPAKANCVQIPGDAAIRASSTDSVVFIAEGKGHFAGRKVILGPTGDDGMVVVKAGLKPGERVVTSAQFLLDSEARLSEASQSMLNHGGSGK